jgi:glycosyltransferase involved in cell wall biosynthesis
MDNIKKVVVTLTTVPERLSDTKYGENGMIACIRSLQNQNYDDFEIHFNIPYVSAYSGDEYIIPEWLGDEFDKVKIFRMDDLGAVTKIIPTIERITNPETIIIVCDDDLVYHEDMVKEHVKNQLERDCVFGYDSLGTDEPKFNDVRDHFVVSVPFEMSGKIMQHYKTVSYKRRYFDDDFFIDFVGKTKSDDILLSAYMNKQGIKKIVIPYEHEEKIETLEEWQGRGGVLTFPVLRHAHHDTGDGCRDPRCVAIQIPFYTPDELKKYL